MRHIALVEVIGPEKNREGGYWTERVRFGDKEDAEDLPYFEVSRPERTQKYKV